MVRRLTVVVGLAMLLLVAREGSACSVTPIDLSLEPVNLDTLALGGAIVPSLTDVFRVAMPPPLTMGEIVNNVYFDGSQYTYVHTVTPSLNNNVLMNTAFEVAGFTGVAGWSFSQALAAGGAGTAADFFINSTGQLSWLTLFGPGLGWDALEPISFFFVSTRPPGIGDFNLIGLEAGTAQSYAPTPEPGSIALIGAGLVGLYATMRRRRRLRA
jgi:hypothetical protein